MFFHWQLEIFVINPPKNFCNNILFRKGWVHVLYVKTDHCFFFLWFDIPDFINKFFCVLHCMKKRIFLLRKFVKSTEKIIFTLVFLCFRFTKISWILSFPSNENVRKQHLSANAYFWVNKKFSYMIAGRKDKIFYVVL